jgi:DNA-binding SARP family transcriptional activator/predicted ATPase
MPPQPSSKELGNVSSVSLCFLGRPRIERDGTPVTVGRRKALALLAYLAVTARAHTRDTVATLLWPELSQSKARAGLRNALTSLRNALGKDCLETDREFVRLSTHAGFRIDVEEFRGRLAQTRTHGHPPDAPCADCLSTLAEAVDLYRDDFLAGFNLPDSPTFDEWQFFQSEGLREDLARALESLANALCDDGDCEAALPYARRWLALDPLHEPVHRFLMHLYARSGQRAAALRQYAECERLLKEELGVPPAEETCQLYQAIVGRTELAESTQPSTAPAQTKYAPRHNLPAQLTPLVGREALLADLAERLGDPTCRLLTLVGPGGSGKTRLALEMAAAQLDNYPHGVFFVPLASLESVDSIVPTVAQALDFRFYGDLEPRQQLLDYFRHKHMLLVLDNFEHLIFPSGSPHVEGMEGEEGLVTEILKAAPKVKIVVTSRAAMNIQGEHLFPVAGMNLPDRGTAGTEVVARYSSIKLFLTAVRRTQPGYEATDAVIQDIVRVCHLVHGMPLGILLAAAWTDLLTSAEIAAEISHSFDFLETDARDLPERQRSMRAVFDHSWRLLTEREREVMAVLSVFRGGFARSAAQQVAGASLRDLKGLLEKSLIDRASAPSTGLRTGGRYDIHELLRQYAAEKLAASPVALEQARERHCAYFAGFLARRGQDLKGARQATALAEIEADGENARRAWNWAVHCGQVERLDRAMEGLFLFYERRGRYQEGKTACQAAEQRLAGIESAEAICARARILTWQSIFFEGLGQLEIAHHLSYASLSLLDDPALAGHDVRSEKAFALRQMGNMASWPSDRQEVRRGYEASLALYRELGDRWGSAAALYGLGYAANASGAVDDAEQFLRESLAIRRELGDRMGTPTTLEELVWTSLFRSRFEESERLANEIIAIAQELADPASLAIGLRQLAWTLIWRGRYPEGQSLLEESFTIVNDLGSRGWCAVTLAHLSFVELHLGRYSDARIHGQKALELARHLSYQNAMGLSLHILGAIALAQEAYIEAQRFLRQSTDIFREFEYPANLGLALSSLAAAVCGGGDLDRSRRYLLESLQIAARIGGLLAYLLALPTIAMLLVNRGDGKRALEVYALASRYPLVANSQWVEDVVGKQIAAAAAPLPPDVVAAAQEQGRARDLEATMVELLAEFEATR